MSNIKQNVLIIGNRAREHSLAWKISQSPLLNKLYVAPGNAGTTKIAENVALKPNDTSGLINFARENKIDLTIVGSDEPLAAGIVDNFQKNGLKIFGPTKKAAAIESSKAFSKTFMKEHNIPTAIFQIFTNQRPALSYIKTRPLPIVIKANGLASGKGVFICQSIKEAENSLEQIFEKKVFGDSGNKVVVEDYLEGQEISIHTISNGKFSLTFPAAQDHKAIFDGDKGSNTGGMGSFAPVPFVTNTLMNSIEQTIIAPTLHGLDNKIDGFTGCLFPGLKITSTGPKVLEYNARFGDPETQVFMRLMKSDLLDLLNASVSGSLQKFNLNWIEGFAVCVVLASKGYPSNYETGFEINGIDKAEKLENIVVFHSGTKLIAGKFVTSGGRVLSITATGKNLKEAVDKAYSAVNLISFEGMHFRTDIAHKSLD